MYLQLNCNVEYSLCYLLNLSIELKTKAPSPRNTTVEGSGIEHTSTD